VFEFRRESEFYEFTTDLAVHAFVELAEKVFGVCASLTFDFYKWSEEGATKNHVLL
jgi:hypothetical protein